MFVCNLDDRQYSNFSPSAHLLFSAAYSIIPFHFTLFLKFPTLYIASIPTLPQALVCSGRKPSEPCIFVSSRAISPVFLTATP